jgi:hypothetical protein
MTLPCLAETPEEVLMRLERGRSSDAIEEQRRQETLEWQKRQKEKAYSARWKRYGDFEVDVTQWRQQKDGVWITLAKYGLLVGTSGGLSWPSDEDATRVPLIDRLNRLVMLEPPPLRRLVPTPIGNTTPPKRFDQSLDELVRQGFITPKERCLSSQKSSVCKEVEMSNWIGVSCKSLHFNKKIAGKPWGKWERPLPGSNEEILVVERCASTREQNEGTTDKSL